jgi:hypothetical protein
MGKLYGALASQKRKSIIKVAMQTRKNNIRYIQRENSTNLERTCSTSYSKHSYDGKL